MGAQSLLEQLLKSRLSGGSAGGLQGLGLGDLGRQLGPALQSGLGALTGGSGGAGGRAAAGGESHLGKYLTGGAVGSALTMLVGSRRGRKLGGTALKVGSVAALGALAFKVYNDWQASQRAAGAFGGTSTGTSAGTSAGPFASPAPAAPQPFAALPAPQQEDHSRAMLKAMIAAAKSDGHLDERESGLLAAELRRLDADPALQAWVEAEIRCPVEPAEVAAGVRSPEMAAEVYLASLLVVDETTTMERAYLDALARALRLEPGLQRQIEAQAAAL